MEHEANMELKWGPKLITKIDFGGLGPDFEELEF